MINDLLIYNCSNCDNYCSAKFDEKFENFLKNIFTVYLYKYLNIKNYDKYSSYFMYLHKNNLHEKKMSQKLLLDTICMRQQCHKYCKWMGLILFKIYLTLLKFN